MLGVEERKSSFYGGVLSLILTIADSGAARELVGMFPNAILLPAVTSRVAAGGKIRGQPSDKPL